jgi:predicted RNA binding protein YcfA (HicA-like mRNA interferase family)
LRGKELVKLLHKKGWHVDRVQGSHYVMKNGKKTEVIPVHNRDLPTGLLKAILKRLEQDDVS